MPRGVTEREVILFGHFFASLTSVIIIWINIACD